MPALGTARAHGADGGQDQYVTDVARGYALFLANCAHCHGDQRPGRRRAAAQRPGQAVQRADRDRRRRAPGHLNPNYLQNVLTVGGRYVCGDANSVMPAWLAARRAAQLPPGGGAHRWITAPNTVVLRVPARGPERGGDRAEPVETVTGWRDPNYQPRPATDAARLLAQPQRRHRRFGAGGRPRRRRGTVDQPGHTPPSPRVIKLDAERLAADHRQHRHPGPGHHGQGRRDRPVRGRQHGRLRPQLLHRHAAELSSNSHGNRHPAVLRRAPRLHLDRPGERHLQFACTLPGHYSTMHGDIDIGP